MKKVSKKDFQTFLDKTEQILSDKGATKRKKDEIKFVSDSEGKTLPFLSSITGKWVSDSINRNKWIIYSKKFGKVSVTIYEENNSPVFSIFCKFEDVETTKTVFDCNPYSGKNNFHTVDLDEILAQFEDFLNEA